MDYRYGILVIDMVINHIDVVINAGHELMIWEMPVSMCSSSISICDILSFCSEVGEVHLFLGNQRRHVVAAQVEFQSKVC